MNNLLKLELMNLVSSAKVLRDQMFSEEITLDQWEKQYHALLDNYVARIENLYQKEEYNRQ